MDLTCKNKIVFVSTGFFFLVPLLGGTNVAYAHGFGPTMQKEVGNYTVDVDADALTLQAGEQVRFNFNIMDTKDITLSPEFTDAWVRIAPKNGFGIVFAGDLHKPESGGTGMTHTFPKGGEYELTVRFQKDGENVADEVSFPLTVEDDPIAVKKSVPRKFFMGLFLGALITGAAVFFLKKK